MGKRTQEPKEPPPWDRRPWAEKGDEDIETTYAAVGRLLSQWERHEAALAFLFSSFIETNSSLAARRAYVSVRTFEGRLEMLRAASSTYFSDHPNNELQEAFKIVLSKASCYSQRRNDVAHGTVDLFAEESFFLHGSEISSDAEMTEIFYGKEYCLYPSFASFKERDLKDKPSYCMSSEELNYFTEEIGKLIEPVHILCGRLMLIELSAKQA